MKKVLKIAAPILLALTALIIAGIIFIGRLPSPGAGYQEKLETGGAVEAEYLKTGGWETAYYEQAAMQNF